MEEITKRIPRAIIRSHAAIVIITVTLAIIWLSCMIKLFLWLSAPMYVAMPAIIITEVLLCIIIYSNCTVKWQIWAYSNVSSIFELDQTQGFESGVNLKNAPEISLFLSSKDQEQKARIVARLKGTFEFIDDMEVPDSITVRYTSLRAIIYDEGNLALSNEGIVFPDLSSYLWKDIEDEDVITSGTRNDRYKMTCRVGNYMQALPAGNFGVSPFQLKHLLYIYRQRYRLAHGDNDIVKVLEDTPLFPNTPHTLTDRLLTVMFNMMANPFSRITSIVIAIAASLYILISTIQSIHYNLRNNEAYDGIITGKYINHQAHGAHNITVSGYGDVLVQWNTYEHLDSGDHVIKKKGEIKTFVIRGSDTTMYDNADF